LKIVSNSYIQVVSKVFSYKKNGITGQANTNFVIQARWLSYAGKVKNKMKTDIAMHSSHILPRHP